MRTSALSTDAGADGCGIGVALHDVRPVMADAAAVRHRQGAHGIAGCTLLLDVTAMRHEESQLRLFAG
ncbi:hypothetical protein GCM10018793_70850 [Streptomyces sulfonofaciens]|uniref:Uncharacterized protein n=1 Tax=Streptomyces sulfonofaciens TaxID=68272 RepID=A0A919LAW7_9ACTN|nr:hypothetical protein GCM10018793_70850 [Streptomyces sulfonofaciens]